MISTNYGAEALIISTLVLGQEIGDEMWRMQDSLTVDDAVDISTFCVLLFAP